MEPPSSVFADLQFLNQLFIGFSLDAVIALLAMIAFLFCSALVSGSEVAFFSLGAKELEELEDDKDSNAQRVLELLENPNKLLATILIANNFINVAIILLSSYLAQKTFNFSDSPILGFVIQVLVITFLIVLFGEVAPKVYATQRNLSLAKFMSKPLDFAGRIFSPLSSILMGLINVLTKQKLIGNQKSSVDDLGQALNLTQFDEIDPKEQQILRGIVNFGNIEVSQIMTPRIDVEAIDVETNFTDLIEIARKSGYSRFPVYKESFDQVVGVIFAKDLLQHINAEEFNWRPIMRKPYFVPENRKIDDLLRDFQTKKTHLAIVVDEYGGSSGIITLEDIIEEIIGEISDEFDEDDINFKKINENTYLFEAKIQLNDFYKALEITGEEFEDYKGDAETLAGFILELSGKIPKKNEEIIFKNYKFKIEMANNKRIEQILLHRLAFDSNKESKYKES
ncbi:MAG: gliding motility-associated protein GldE [Luteibaculaceae bacterium]